MCHQKIKPHLKDFEVFTVNELGWSGVKNGKLMTLCVENKFDILLTIDKNLVNQQNLDKYPVTVVVFNANSSKIDELVLFVPSFKLQVPGFKNHHAYFIERPE